MAVKINGQAVVNNFDSTMKTDIRKSVQLNPDSVSPVLKTKVVISLESDFPHALKREDFTVNATSQTNSTYVRYLNVIEVDDANKKLTCMFGGAHSGKYDISIRHKDYGLVDTRASGVNNDQGVVLDVGATVTSFSPNTGSIYGGTLLTIDGTNYGKVFTDNPVEISYNGGVGSTKCFVKETSATQIKCRIDTKNIKRTDKETATMVVFLKTSEEAKCDPSSKCKYTYTSELP